MDHNCIFCKIASKDIPGKIVYEDDVCLAFLDLSQATNGHTLVIPKQHFDSVLTADEETVSHIFAVAAKLARDITAKMDANGCNLLTNAGEVAGQSVKHFHVHIIPRYDENDGVKMSFQDRSKDVNLDAIYERIVK